MSTTKSFFVKMYDGLSEELKKMKRPQAIRSSKRQLRSAWDDAENKIDAKLVEVQNQFESITECNYNSVLSLKGEIRGLKEQQADIAATYEELHGVKFVPTEE